MSLIRTIFFKWFNPSAYGGDAKTDAPQAEQPYGASSFQLAGTTKEEIYKKLVAVARGDTHQVLYAMDAISLFERASTKMRLAILEEFVGSPLIGDKHAVGDLFVMLMEKSTADERRKEIYPALNTIIQNTKESPQPMQGKRSFLAALLRGWMSEI